MTDKSLEVLDRIYKNKFKVLRDPKGLPLNVSYTEDGLKYTLDNKGNYVYNKNGNYVEDFKPCPKLLSKNNDKRAKFEKRWVDKANAMLYQQRN